MSDLGRGFDWDDEIEKDGGEFVLLPEGDYSFEVTAFERARHSGSAKVPPCNKAVLTLEIDGLTKGKTTIMHNLFLHTSTEGFLSAFFAGIGQKKKGEKLRMNWSTVIGSTGRCHVFVDKYTNKDGEERESNKIKKFYAKDGGATFTKGQF